VRKVRNENVRGSAQERAAVNANAERAKERVQAEEAKPER